MKVIFTYIYSIQDPNVGKFSIHGAYGYRIYGSEIYLESLNRLITGATLYDITPDGKMFKFHDENEIVEYHI